MKVIIVGARRDGHAKVVLEIVKAEGKYDVLGFVDDDPEKVGTHINDVPVICSMAELPLKIREEDIQGGIVAIGNNEQRRLLALKLSGLGLHLVNAIHPTAHIDSGVTLGNGCVICQGAIIISGTTIGNCVNIHTGSTIDHDNVLEAGVNLGPGVNTAGRVTIRKDSFIGTGSVVIPDVTIGEGCIVGAGSVVIRNLPAFSKSVGNPARIIG